MDKERKPIEIELRSDEFQEIVQQSPRWLIRSGIMLVLGFIILLLAGSYFFKYPDVINADIVVLSENPPAYLAARTTGRIDSILVTDQQIVSDGQIIAILENTAHFKDAMKLKDLLVKMEPFMQSFDTLEAVHPVNDLQLGDIQSDYSSFVRIYNDYFTLLRLKLHPKKIKALRQQIAMNKIYYDRLWAQKRDMDADFKIANNQFKRDSSLQLKGVLSDLDLEKTKGTLIQKKYNLNGSRTKLAETQSSIIKLEQEVVDAEMEFADQKKKAQNTLIEAMNVLKSRWAYWEQAFVIKSPTSGKVSFATFWSKNQQVKKDEIVFSVIPERQSQIIGRINLPVKGAGKVAVGQKVNIRFENFPYMEYGYVRGAVRNISLMPNNESYVVEVEMPQDLKTNYDINLKFTQEMKGSAEIITSDLRLIQRIFNPVRSLLKHRVAPVE
ncbi:MAG TPA: HlyD family efflux transporter periplasmic adaptor subunit [Prolixibacteraceae bacterium]|jgi:HlyD family secretion protein|nr:HlyD family efflux transporter periplasmic adaptor subunit [Prolixibacteraceae bacterium]HPR85758.1 HlyD family efflux transporter periplasmic adaptor subunit [Prolixibacteraceae bacterium]